jgi:hypothetical protein
VGKAISNIYRVDDDNVPWPCWSHRHAGFARLDRGVRNSWAMSDKSSRWKAPRSGSERGVGRLTFNTNTNHWLSTTCVRRHIRLEGMVLMAAEAQTKCGCDTRRKCPRYCRIIVLNTKLEDCEVEQLSYQFIQRPQNTSLSICVRKKGALIPYSILKHILNIEQNCTRYPNHVHQYPLIFVLIRHRRPSIHTIQDNRRHTSTQMILDMTMHHPDARIGHLIPNS